VGVVIVAGGEKTPDESDAEAVRRSARGIGWAIFAAVGFAMLFWLLGIRIIARVGAVQTVWMIRLTSTLLTAAAIVVSKQPVRLPRGEVRLMVLGMGVFDTGAFVLSNLGMKMEQVAVISVLGSLYGAVTVGLAAFFLREHVSRWQWMGIVTIFVGIVLISR
jgi:drug/metabolite transporter (DMT)-like permease